MLSGLKPYDHSLCGQLSGEYHLHTPLRLQPSPELAVHPRGRGEQKCPTCHLHCTSGSSPRARGTGGAVPGQPVRERFIPADAGNKHSAEPPTCSSSVHPRGRGEQVSAFSTVSVNTGSSPRARGTEHPERLGVAVPRFIPAGAGNSHPVPSVSMPLAVHPRGRGEQPLPREICQPSAGSSPRTRGTVAVKFHSAVHGRFIPADAGNSR